MWPKCVPVGEVFAVTNVGLASIALGMVRRNGGFGGTGGRGFKANEQMTTANICVNKHSCLFAQVASNCIREGQFQEHVQRC